MLCPKEFPIEELIADASGLETLRGKVLIEI